MFGGKEVRPGRKSINKLERQARGEVRCGREISAPGEPVDELSNSNLRIP